MAAEQVAEQVADHLEEAAQVTRQIDSRAVGFFFSGVAVGVFAGFIVGYRFNREKIKAEAFKKSEEEVQKIRDHYQQKVVAASPKPSVSQVVAERGYALPEDLPERPLPPPVPITEEELRERSLHIRTEDVLKRVFRTELSSKDKNDGWSFPKELARRTPDEPHIIHQDEFANNDSEYQQTTYIYYVEDDVLVDEDETVINNRENLIGHNVLTRFGHGTDDYNILYIRNPLLELEIEICRSPGSYEEEVLGLEREDGTDDNETG